MRNWNRAKASYFKPFVSHRIGEIQNLTDSIEWRHIPGRINTSDLATRSNSMSRTTSTEAQPREWFAGPDFFRQPHRVAPGSDLFGVPGGSTTDDRSSNPSRRNKDHLSAVRVQPILQPDKDPESSCLRDAIHQNETLPSTNPFVRTDN